MKLKKQILNNKKIIENFSYLTIFQIFSLLTPLITYPYLLRVVGLEMYGIVIYAQAIVTYFSLFINFGFNISGPKDVAVYREDHRLLSELVSSIYIIKSVIWAICLIAYMVVIFSFDIFYDHILVYIFAYFITIGDVLFPIWFFQGIEKMKYITFINLFVRTLFILAVFVFIKQSSDYFLIPLLNSIGALISGFIAIYVVFKKEGVVFTRVPKLVIVSHIKQGFSLFISTISVQIYMNLNKIIVGSFLGMKEVTVYDLAEKITSLLKTPIIMISQAVFPKISREKSIAFINNTMFFVTSLVTVIYLGLFFTTDWLVLFFTGSKIPMAITVVRIVGLSLIFLSFSMFLGGARLIPFGFNKEYMFSMIANSIVYFLIIGVLWIFDLINIYTISVTTVSVEIFCVVLLYFINKKLHLLRPKIPLIEN